MVESGDCENPMEYELTYYDAPLGNITEEDSGEASEQDIACIDGHDVCANQCEMEKLQEVKPPVPTSSYYVLDDNDGICSGGVCGSDGYISWSWKSDDVYAQDQCNPTVDNCWTDVTEEYYSGDSSEYAWECDPSVFQETATLGRSRDLPPAGPGQTGGDGR